MRFIVALGLIVANWESITDFVKGAGSEQEQLLSSTQETLEVQQEQLEAMDLNENSLRLQGKSEREIRQLK